MHSQMHIIGVAYYAFIKMDLQHVIFGYVYVFMHFICSCLLFPIAHIIEMHKFLLLKKMLQQNMR